MTPDPRVSAMRETITAPGAPPAVGPYAHAVRAGGLLFCSGQIPLHPETGEIAGATAGEQAERCLRNLEAVCQAVGARLSDAAKLTIYTTDMDSFGEVNAVYAGFFEHDPPARVAIGVSRLPREALVEIDAIVVAPAPSGGAE